jgi:hypothetical protein
MSSEPLPIFRGHPDRPVDPPPELSPGNKKSKSRNSDAQTESGLDGMANLFEQTPTLPLTETAAQDAAATPENMPGPSFCSRCGRPMPSGAEFCACGNHQCATCSE